MPIQFDYDAALNVLNSHPYDTISVSEIKTHFDELASSRDVQNGFIFTVDFRKVESIPYAFLDASELVRAYLKLKDKKEIRALIYLAKGNMQYGMSRMFQTLLKLRGDTDSVFVVRSDEEMKETINKLIG